MITQTRASATTEGAPGNPKPTVRLSAPPELADVALIDAPRIAAAACMSLSTWHELVRVGMAPQPAIRAPRCTRWRLADVRAWLIERATRGGDPEAARAVVRNAAIASLAAKVKRQQSKAGA